MTAQLLVDLLLEAISPARIALLAKQFGMPEDKVEAIGQCDPANGKYLTWLLRQVRAGYFKFPDDKEKMATLLSQFDKLSRKPKFQGEKDINRYASYEKLLDVVYANRDVVTKGEAKRSAATEGCKLISSDGDDVLYLVTTEEATAKLFRHTEWCVKDPKRFYTYDPQEFYYVERNCKPFALMHLESGQLKNVDDKELTEEVPILEPYIAKVARLASAYAEHVIHGPWPPGEKAISQSALNSYYYARDIIKGPWPPGEKAISKNPTWAVKYQEFLASIGQ